VRSVSERYTVEFNIHGMWRHVRSIHTQPRQAIYFCQCAPTLKLTYNATTVCWQENMETRGRQTSHQSHVRRWQPAAVACMPLPPHMKQHGRQHATCSTTLLTTHHDMEHRACWKRWCALCTDCRYIQLLTLHMVQGTAAMHTTNTIPTHKLHAAPC
jgi:hypothetical protein